MIVITKGGNIAKSNCALLVVDKHLESNPEEEDEDECHYHRGWYEHDIIEHTRVEQFHLDDRNDDEHGHMQTVNVNTHMHWVEIVERDDTHLGGNSRTLQSIYLHSQSSTYNLLFKESRIELLKPEMS